MLQLRLQSWVAKLLISVQYSFEIQGLVESLFSIILRLHLPLFGNRSTKNVIRDSQMTREGISRNEKQLTIFYSGEIIQEDDIGR